MQPVIIKRERVAFGPQPSPGERTASASCGSAKTRRAVRAIEQDGVVVAVELTCSCGEVSLVELRYPQGSEDPS